MSRLLLATIFAILMTGAGSVAHAADAIEDRLLGPDSFPLLELVEDESLDAFEDVPGLETNSLAAIDGWVRAWVQPFTGDGIVVTAVNLPLGSESDFVEGFQGQLSDRDRFDHPGFANVVVFDVDGVSTLATAFATEGTGLSIVTTGPDRRNLLDQAVAAQLLTLNQPALPPESGNSAERTGYVMGQILGGAAAVGAGIWFWRWSRRKGAQASARTQV